MIYLYCSPYSATVITKQIAVVIVLKLFILSFARHSSAGSDGPWTLPRMPTTRTRLRCWSVWTAWRKVCLDLDKVDWMVSRAGRRVRPRSSPPPIWFSTIARGRSLMCSPDPDLQWTEHQRCSDCGQCFRAATDSYLFSLSMDSDYTYIVHVSPAYFGTLLSMIV